MQIGCVSTPVGSDASPDLATIKMEKVSPHPVLPKKTITKLGAPQKSKPPAIGSLLGSEAEDIQKLFGVPDFVRRDFGTQFWRYKGKDCLLNLAMYQKKDENIYRVVHLETSDDNGRLVEVSPCLKKIFLKAQDFRG